MSAATTGVIVVGSIVASAVAVGTMAVNGFLKELEGIHSPQSMTGPRPQK